MIRVLAYTGGEDVPSARFRVRQYIPALRELGVELDESPSRFGMYPPRARWARPLWGVANLGSRLLDVSASRRYDVTFLQREFLSRFLTSERFTKAPRVLDVDDAIWLLLGEKGARRIAQLCDKVLCGNAFLAEHFVRWNRNTVLLPTAVDTGRFVPAPLAEDESSVIGWSGSSGGLPFLYAIEPALSRVFELVPHARLRVVCDTPPRFRTLPKERVDFLIWTPSNEVESIQSLAIGIMPMTDDEFSRGKCSLKMLLYLACGVPAVVSPVGLNAEILSAGAGALGAVGDSDWTEALVELLRDPDARRSMGETGRRLVEERYSVRALAPVLARELTQTAGAGCR